MPTDQAKKVVADGDSILSKLDSSAYIEHLAEVNRTHDVVASSDILNNQGILLLRQGQRLSRDAVKHIVQFKLMRPIESTTEIVGTLTAQSLQEIIEKTLQNTPFRQRYFDEIHHYIEQGCAEFFRFPVLAQKLTVLSLQMPREFLKSVLIASIGQFLAAPLHFRVEDRINFFIAALTHEIGLLHIPQQILEKEGRLSDEEWRAIKCHPIVGSKILEQVSGLSKDVVRAVYEHHEMPDGTGYPASKFAPELSLISQTIGLLDSALTIYFNKLAPNNLGTRFLAPILQINSSSYHTHLLKAVIGELKSWPHETTVLVPEGEIGSFIERMANEAEQLNDQQIKLFAIVTIIENVRRKETRLTVAATTLSDQLQTIIRRSGIFAGDYFDTAAPTSSAQLPTLEAALEEGYMMLQELRWQLTKLRRICSSIMEEEGLLNPDSCAMLHDSLQTLQI